MQYLFVLACAPEAWADNTPDTADGVIDDWAVYTRALHDAGVLVAGHALEGTDTATTVRVRSRARLLTDGPYADIKEHLIGYYLIEAPDLDVALAWAAKAPNARVGSVEVRPIMPGSSTIDVLAGR
jgi:hypothetical protein